MARDFASTHRSNGSSDSSSRAKANQPWGHTGPKGHTSGLGDQPKVTFQNPRAPAIRAGLQILACFGSGVVRILQNGYF